MADGETAEIDYAKNDTADEDDWRYMGSQYRKLWRSQYYGDNVMYYNPPLK